MGMFTRTQGMGLAALIMAGSIFLSRFMGLVRDKVIRVYERPVMQCWSAVKDVLGVNGAIIHEDVMQSTITARVDTRTVWVKVEAIDPKMTRISTQVRTRFRNSDLDLAGEIDKQVALRLATGQLPAPSPTPAK